MQKLVLFSHLVMSDEGLPYVVRTSSSHSARRLKHLARATTAERFEQNPEPSSTALPPGYKSLASLPWLPAGWQWSRSSHAFVAPCGKRFYTKEKVLEHFGASRGPSCKPTGALQKGREAEIFEQNPEPRSTALPPGYSLLASAPWLPAGWQQGCGTKGVSNNRVFVAPCGRRFYTKKKSHGALGHYQ